ncbi:hypothetical protein HDR58_09940 [bacterium]|nr:hypothetical protein [bacterium]
MVIKTSNLKIIAIIFALIFLVMYIFIHAFLLLLNSFCISMDVFGFVDPIPYASLSDLKKAIISSLYPELPVYVLINFIIYFVLMAVYNLANKIYYLIKKKASEQ